MAIGKADVLIDLDKLLIKFGKNIIIQNGNLSNNYNETEIAEYMKNDNILIDLDFSIGTKSFTAFTMDLTKKYIDINADYRT